MTGPCYIAPDAWARITAEARAAVDRTETGGLLVGYFAEGAAVVMEATGPGPGAVRRFAWFEPDTAAVQAEARRLSGDCTDEIGGWHTHFQDRPWPSIHDDRTGREQAAARAAWWEPLDIEIILGVSLGGAVLATRAWAYEPDGTRRQLQVLWCDRPAQKAPA